MNYIVSPWEQGSPEWLADRLGRVTGSRVADIFAKTAKGEYTAQRRKYALELALERLTGIQPPVFVSWEMKQGTEREP
ncbi:MAG: hypothetical protein KGH75_14340, partial [Rhodospirillales bacterium]|nr:hypothetical protein [Rhodospirillales bacterium]